MCDRNSQRKIYMLIAIMKKKILFLCTGNSCRSQMAEGWTKFLKKDEIDAYSAGIETHGLNPYAVKVMAKKGVDMSITNQQMKKLLSPRS